MGNLISRLTWAPAVLLSCRFAAATTFYVSPSGSDDAAGTSAEHPWATCEKVVDHRFAPGDTVLFRRGGAWRARLQASSDGAIGKPITYAAYGQGAKPVFWGSDVLDNAKFTPAGDHRYAYPIATQADSALADHTFTESAWTAGRLTITTDGDPRVDGKLYTACVRGNVIFSNGKSHLAFRDLVVDETAGQLLEGPNQGYGVRVEGGSDVRVESCEAYRVGRHHFAAINTTGFVGRHLVAAYVVPRMPGDNTAFVSYADAGAPVAHCTSVWDDVSATHLEDGHGGRNLTFVSHGDHQGPITLEDSTAETKLSFMTAPVVVRHVTLRGDASVENWGAGAVVDGVTLLGSSAIDQWASDGTIQNCVAHLTPTGGGPTGYGTAIVCRDKARRNVIRFNTLVTGKFSCLTMAGPASATRWYGNIMLADGTTVAGPTAKGDIAAADDNFYGPAATFCGLTLAAWQAAGFDKHSSAGDPGFVDAAAGNFQLRSGSAAAHGVAIAARDLPPRDAAGRDRTPGSRASIGAFELAR